MSSRFCAFLLKKVMGWTMVGDSVFPERNCIALEAPHTSIWDFVIGYLYYRALGGHLRTMIKKEAFFFPFSLFLRALGGFPIDRSHPQKLIMSIVDEMRNSGETGKPFHLAMCPEGTRKAVHKWKTGYHSIATAAGVPVYITFIDWKEKRVGVWGKVELTDDARADTDRIQQIYEDMHLTGLHPEGYATK